jgi:hypothetical protein
MHLVTMPSAAVAMPPFAPPATPVPPTPFTLTAQRDDVALFKDARAGFSHLVPGRPTLAPIGARPGELPADAALHLQDAPITLRYHLAPPAFAAPSAVELARVTAEHVGGLRATGRPLVELANATWLGSWGVEAAAVAAYDVADGASHEDLFVLVRQGLVMTVTWTCPRGLTGDPAYATFASIAEATMVWDPLRWEQRGRVWPESGFFAPGLYGAPRPQHAEAARQLARVALAPPERARLLDTASRIVSRAGAPWVRLGRESLIADKADLLAATRDPSVRAFVEGAFADVRTSHDLRGLAILLGRAFGS